MGRDVGDENKEKATDALARDVHEVYNRRLWATSTSRVTDLIGEKTLTREENEGNEKVIFYTHHEDRRNVAPVYAVSSPSGQKPGISKRQRPR